MNTLNKRQCARAVFSVAAVLVATLALATTGRAQTPDTALVVNLAGAAQYSSADAAGRAAPLQPFLRLRRGDAVELAADARLGLAYLASGVVESWSGPSQFKVGDAGSQPVKGAPVQVQPLPRTLLDRLARAPDVLADLRNRQGLVVTREIGKPEPVAVQQARTDQDTVKAQAPASGTATLPDLNLFLALYESRQYREADKVIDELARRQPDDPMVVGLAKEFQRVYRKPAP
ncbi:MAG: hypothetical protein JWP29_4070 [Rhodoferax sp.]|nr:hypothetical protein [Rhodoferax sp.]